MTDGPLQSVVNGQQAERISVRDRGLQYGDGCFETLRVARGEPILREAHLERLRQACSVLQLATDFDALQREIETILNSNSLTDAVLKITITRGSGGRGYAPPRAAECSRILQLFGYSSPDTTRGARVVLCRHRLSANTQLAGIKHLNRLDQVLASAQIPPGFDEGLCMDQDDNLIEGCRSNLCIALDGAILSPALTRCGVEGVMLNYLIDEFAQRELLVSRSEITLQMLQSAEEVFLCNSVFGVWPLAELSDGQGELYWSGVAGPRGLAATQIAEELFRRVE